MKSFKEFYNEQMLNEAKVKRLSKNDIKKIAKKITKHFPKGTNFDWDGNFDNDYTDFYKDTLISPGTHKLTKTKFSFDIVIDDANAIIKELHKLNFPELYEY